MARTNLAPGNQMDARQRRCGWRFVPAPIYVLILSVLTLLPIANIVSIIAGNGVDSLSNDYLEYAGLIDQVLSGHYNWLNFIQDTFYKTHSVALPVLIHIADARLFHWNIYVELYIGVALAFLRLMLWHSTLSRHLSGRRKWLLLPFLSALIFSASQISIFSYGDGALTIELSLFGFALAISGLFPAEEDPVKRRITTEQSGAERLDTRLGTNQLKIQSNPQSQPRLNIIPFLAGGLIASYSWGNGIVTWFVLLLALVLFGARTRKGYLLWLSGLALSLMPYMKALVLDPIIHPAPVRTGTTIVSLLNWRFMVNALGWPFTSDIGFHTESLPMARLAGWTGIALAAMAIAVLAAGRRRTLWKHSHPALLFLLHGILSIWQISVFRGLIAPWYTGVAMTFWAGLIALALLVNAEIACPEFKRPFVKAFALLWSLAVPAFLISIYLASNLTYQDKSNLLFSRSPASASALRNFRTAPTYGESLVFQWGAGNPGLLQCLATPLSKHRLSVFAPHQVWTLQGDFLLDSVKLSQPANSSGVFWTASQSASGRLPWYHYKRLNLLLPTPSAMAWTVKLPANIAHAEFRSAVAFSSSGGAGPDNAGTIFLVRVEPPGGSGRITLMKHVKAGGRGWEEIEIPLTAYRGKTLRIVLTSRNLNGRTGSLCLYRYPCIDIQGSAEESPGRETDITPSNTDLSPDFARPGRDDFICDWRDTAWKLPANCSIEPSGVALPPEAALTYAKPLPLDLSTYSHFLISASEPACVSPRVVTVEFKLENEAKPRTFQVPLLADSAMHSYTYDLKLLELPRASRLLSFKISLDGSPAVKGKAAGRIANIRFIDKTGPRLAAVPGS